MLIRKWKWFNFNENFLQLVAVCIWNFLLGNFAATLFFCESIKSFLRFVYYSLIIVIYMLIHFSVRINLVKWFHRGLWWPNLLCFFLPFWRPDDKFRVGCRLIPSRTFKERRNLFHMEEISLYIQERCTIKISDCYLSIWRSILLYIALCRLFSFRIILLSSLSLVKPKYLLFPSNENILRLLSNSGTSYCNHVFNISFSLRLFDPLNKADSGLFFCDWCLTRVIIFCIFRRTQRKLKSDCNDVFVFFIPQNVDNIIYIRMFEILFVCCL